MASTDDAPPRLKPNADAIDESPPALSVLPTSGANRVLAVYLRGSGRIYAADMMNVRIQTFKKRYFLLQSLVKIFLPGIVLLLVLMTIQIMLFYCIQQRYDYTGQGGYAGTDANDFGCGELLLGILLGNNDFHAGFNGFN